MSISFSTLGISLSLAASTLMAIAIAALPPPITAVGETLQIRNLNNDLCLDVPGGRADRHLKIQQYRCREGGDKWISAQLWTLEKIGDYVQIRNPHSGQCLDIPDGRAANHINVQQYDCRQRGDRWLSAQLWSLERIEGYVQIRNLRTGLCLDVPAGAPQNHAVIQQYNCRDWGDRWIEAQLWRLGR